MKQEKESLKKVIVKWSLFALLVAATVVVFVFSPQIFGVKDGIDVDGNIIWNPKSIFNESVSVNPFLQYMYEHAIPNTLRTIQIAGVAVALGVALHYFAKLTFKSKKGKTISKLIANFLKWVIALTAVFFTMDAWGADTTTMLASAGVLTLIIGLGSQTLVADILAGIFIVFEGDFQVGDIVLIDNWRGEILEIGIRTTKLMDWAGNIKIVNNSEIKTIINQTKELSAATCYVSISYDARIEEVENVIADNLVAIGEKNPLILDGPYYKGVSELGQSSVVLLFVARCKEEDVYQVQRDLNRDIKILFDNNGITIPYNQLDVHLDSGESVSTRVTSKTSQKAEEFNDEQRELSKDIYVEK